MLNEVGNDLALSPAPIVTIGLGEKSTMAAVIWFDQSYVGVTTNSGSCFRKQAYEGIIFGVHDE